LVALAGADSRALSGGCLDSFPCHGFLVDKCAQHVDFSLLLELRDDCFGLLVPGQPRCLLIELFTRDDFSGPTRHEQAALERLLVVPSMLNMLLGRHRRIRCIVVSFFFLRLRLLVIWCEQFSLEISRSTVIGQ